MPRYFFHLHAGDSWANPDKRGQDLSDADAARQMAQRIARRLLEWNLEPVQWLDYQVQVTDEAGAIVSELPLTEVVDQIASESAGAEAEPDVSPRGQLLDESSEPLEQVISPETAGLSGRKDLDAIMASLALELQEVTQSQAPVQDPAGPPNEAQQPYRLRAAVSSQNGDTTGGDKRPDQP
jgi:hypothetical protein